jgi:hypothetical protein
MSFAALLQIPELGERYRKIKQYFFLKESAYDVTSACQLRCDGCYFFEGAKSQLRDNRDPEAWRSFFTDEKQRGITYVVLAGAEPALVPKVLKACYEVIPLGCIATNGLRAIDPELRYRIHLSVWGDSAHDPLYRKLYGGHPGPDCLTAQLKNYKNDDRTLFVYTFNHHNIDQVMEVANRITGEGHQLTFNVFSNPQHSSSSLKVDDTLAKIYDRMIDVMERFGDSVIYSYYNAEVHTHTKGLHDLFGCIYPRARQMGSQVKGGIGSTFRSYRTDLTHSVETDCCVPDTDCADCRHFAAGSAIVTSQLHLHAETEQRFRAWLDYVDSYLATWVLGFKKGVNLYSRPKESILPLET